MRKDTLFLSHIQYYRSICFIGKNATCNPQLEVEFCFIFGCPHLVPVQPYRIILFFILNFIYIRYIYAHTHAKGNSKKVAGCRLRFEVLPKNATRNLQLCNFHQLSFRHSDLNVKAFHLKHQGVFCSTTPMPSSRSRSPH